MRIPFYKPRYKRMLLAAEREDQSFASRQRAILDLMAREEAQKDIALKRLGMEYGKGGFTPQRLALQRKGMEQQYDLQTQFREARIAEAAEGREFQMAEAQKGYGWRRAEAAKQHAYGEKMYRQALPYMYAGMLAKGALGYEDWAWKRKQAQQWRTA